MNLFEITLIVKLFVLNESYFNDKKCKTGTVSNRADRHDLSYVKVYLYYFQMDYH